MAFDDSLWHDTAGDAFVPRAPLAIVGAGCTGLWTAYYLGDGVATANLAGRTLAQLITGHESELTRPPWVGHRSRAWEPEPLRLRAVHRLLSRRLRSRASGCAARR